MKHFLKIFFGFLAFTVFCYVFLLLIVGNYAPVIFKKNLNYKIGSYGHMFTRILEIEKINKVDVLFVGSSHSYRGFDPRIFKKYNYQVFNLGSSSQSPLQEELLLNQYLDKLNPKLIVFEMYPATFESDGVESGLDILANNKIDFNSVKMCLTINNIKLYNTFIFGLYQQLRGINKRYKEDLKKNEDTYIEGGFVERKITYYQSPKDVAGNKRYHINTIQSNTFQKILHKLSNKKIKYVLVQAPISKSCYNSYSNNNEIDSLFNSWGPYYNFNKILSFNDSLFYDKHHLNQNGVMEFNRAFIELLKKENLLNN